MNELKADFVLSVSVIDPDTKAPVDVAIYKDRESAAMFGVDSSYILSLSDEDPVSSPYNGKDIELIETI